MHERVTVEEKNESCPIQPLGVTHFKVTLSCVPSGDEVEDDVDRQCNVKRERGQIRGRTGCGTQYRTKTGLCSWNC